MAGGVGKSLGGGWGLGQLGGVGEGDQLVGWGGGRPLAGMGCGGAVEAVGRAAGGAVVTLGHRSRRAGWTGWMSSRVYASLATLEQRSWRLE